MRVRLALGLALLASPALAVDASATSVTCAAAVTTGIGGAAQQLRDLEPSDLPVLAYRELPGERQFKALTTIGDASIRLYVYRVNEKLLHMQIFTPIENGKQVLADTPLAGDTSELTWAPLGGQEQVTVYCF